MAYTTKHETELDSAEKMKVFIDELDQISGSAVLYGAAANYTGDRAQLCTLFGEDALETSVSVGTGCVWLSGYERLCTAGHC